jgi:hypothetical protein
LKQILKLWIMRVLSFGKLFPDAMTDQAALKSLFKRLRPVRAARELIRLGPHGDGGYLVPNDLDGIEGCFSPGVSLVSGFEMDCANFGMKVFLADRSVDRPAELHERFHFTKKFVGVTTSDDFMTIDDWVAASLPASKEDLILQIDIEGYEYESFLGMSDDLMRRFRIIVAEFHDIDHLWNLLFFRLASRTFDKILQTHKCVHIHPNNCLPPLIKDGISLPPMLEFTFLRNDRDFNPSYLDKFPHPLDFDNTNLPHIALPKCWYVNN